VVLKVDPLNGHIDLSKKRCSPAERADHEAWFAQSKVVHSIMTRIAALSGEPIRKVYEEIGWPLCEQCREVDDTHPLDLLRLAAVDGAAQMARELELSPELSAALAEAIKHRLTLKPLKFCADVEVSCLAAGGVRAIKSALAAALEKYSTREAQDEAEKDEDEEALALQLVASPLFSITLASRHRDRAMQSLADFCELVQQEISKRGGSAHVISPAHVVAV